MNNINSSAIKAKQDKCYCESFISKFEPFILKAAYRTTGRYITKGDDEYSIALLAFNEAIQSYSDKKGMFIPFADLVIRRRLFDYLKKQKHKAEILVSPSAFETDGEEDEHTIPIKQLYSGFSAKDGSTLLEIQTLSETLKAYGFSFFDLISASPKSYKTRQLCIKAIGHMLSSPELLSRLRRLRTLPVKQISASLKLPRKSIERHRKYIIAAIEILDGPYPILGEYLKAVKEVKSE